MTDAAILILECYRQTLPVAWAIKRAGYTPILGMRRGHYDDEFVRFSRLATQTWMHSDWSDPSLVDELKDWISAPGMLRTVLPVGEASLGALMELRRKAPELSRRILIPSDNCIEQTLQKHLYPEWGARMGLIEVLCMPPTLQVMGRDAIAEAGNALGFPLALKPAQTKFRILGKKCIFLNGPEDIAALPPGQISDLKLVAQRRAHGRRHNVMFFASEGELRALFECEVMRTDTYDGTGYGVDVVSVAVQPQHRTAVEALVSGFKWDGLGCAQFVFDPETNLSQFLEVNPRIDANVALCQVSGLNLIQLAIADRIGDALPAANAGVYSIGKRIHWALGDLEGMFEPNIRFSQRVVRAASFVQSFIRADGHSEFRWTDPRPALFLAYRWLGGIAKLQVKRFLSHRACAF